MFAMERHILVGDCFNLIGSSPLCQRVKLFKIVIFSIKIEICCIEYLLGSLFHGMQYLKTSKEQGLFSQKKKVMSNVAFEI